MDYVALVGYTSLFSFGLYKLSDTFKRPVDVIANVLLLIGLFALMTYHYRKIRTQLDETKDPLQKKVRIVAHTSITAFFLLTLTPATLAVFRFYDVFALTAHSYLLYAVASGAPQLAGVGLLALYFAVASFQSARRFSLDNVEVLNAVGRFLLLIFFSMTFANSMKA